MAAMIKDLESMMKTTNVQNNVQNNIQNNVQNNISNTQNVHNKNDLNLSLKDFIHENYDLTHIEDSFYKRDDFFIFDVFLEKIMMNARNQNIYLNEENTDAIIFTENDLNMISTDKVGYLILDKLDKSITQYIGSVDEETQKTLKFIQDYYRIIKGQYRIDTIYKIYNVKTKSFEYGSSSGLFRCRDKNRNKVIVVINKFNAEARRLLRRFEKGGAILRLEPNIEDFLSARCRYKDLKS
jgi:hypothetical protein